VLEFVPPFTIRAETRALVTGIPGTIGTGSVTLDSGSALDLDLVTDALNVTPVMSFVLTAEDEYADVMSVRIGSTGTGNETTIDEVALYLDADGDGEVDNAARPLARTQFTENDGVAVLETGDALTCLPAGETRSFLVTFGSPRAQTLEQIREQALPLAPVGPGNPPTLPWPAVGVLLGVLAVLAALAAATRRLARSPRLARAFAAASCLVLGVMLAGAIGCGGGGLTVDPQVIDPDPAPGSYTITLQATDLVSMGATTGAPVTVTGQPVTSPVVLTDPIAP
jgi:hypothetical protein